MSKLKELERKIEELEREVEELRGQLRLRPINYQPIPVPTYPYYPPYPPYPYGPIITWCGNDVSGPVLSS